MPTCNVFELIINKSAKQSREARKPIAVPIQ